MTDSVQSLNTLLDRAIEPRPVCQLLGTEGPQDSNEQPGDWSTQQVQALSQLSEKELLAALAAQLTRYVQEDDVQIGMPGNEPWVEIFRDARALIAAAHIKLGRCSAVEMPENC